MSKRTYQGRWSALRREIYVRDQGACWVCGRTLPTDGYHLGHIIDRACGGPDTPDNLVVMCQPCNLQKPLHPSRPQAERWRSERGLLIRVCFGPRLRVRA